MWEGRSQAIKQDHQSSNALSNLKVFSGHFQSSHNALRKTAGMSNPLNGVFLACVWLEVHFSGIFYLRSGTYVHIFFFLIFVRNSACGTHIWVKMTNIKLPPNDLCNDTIGVATEIFSGEGRQRLDGELGGIWVVHLTSVNIWLLIKKKLSLVGQHLTS